MTSRPLPRPLFVCLLALAIAVTACGDDEPTRSPQATMPTSTTESAAAAAMTLQFRPVLASAPCDDLEGEALPPGQDVLSAKEGVLCYQVGPVGADGVDVSAAEATSDGAGGWAVSITFADHATDLANEMFDACFRGDESCPPMEGGVGYVAVIVDGVVASAPAVQGENLASQELQVTGRFTEAEANGLAAALDG